MQLKKLKRLIAKVYNTSVNTVQFKTAITKDNNSFTRANVRKLVSDGYVKFKKTKGTTRHKPKKLKTVKKTLWIKQVRMLRAKLRTMYNQIDSKLYRKAYRRIKSAEINTKAKLLRYVNSTN